MQQAQRWDPGQPGFLLANLWTMLGLWLAIMAAGTFAYRSAWSGLLTGGLIAMAAYLIVLQAARSFVQRQRYGITLGWLMCLHLVLWPNMAIAIAVFHVDVVGFALGASVLPIGIVLTSFWYLLLWRGWLK